MAIEDIGTTFVVPITASDITGDNIVSFQFDIQYDHSIMFPSGPNFGCSTAGTIMSGFNVTCNVITNGTLLITANTGGSFIPTGSGTMLNLTFTAQPTTVGGDISPLTFVPATAFVFNNNGIFPRTLVNGQVWFRDPTAAETSVSGRVLNQAGRAIAKARLSLRDANGGVKMALTNPFGYFQFQNVQAGETYVLTTEAKRYTFQPRTVPVADEIVDLAIVSDQ
ncbi:MAG: cohesin domain-containing protein [Pyrinomonadaceae bacterium]